MSKSRTSFFLAIIFTLLLASCAAVDIMPVVIETREAMETESPTVPPTNTREPQVTKSPTQSETPTSTAHTISSTPRPTETPFPTTIDQATIEDYDSLCNETLGSELSPNGKWIAAECIGTMKYPNSHLRVVSIDDTKDWRLYFSDYSMGVEYDHKSILVPYRWSKDGRFLYAVSPSKWSGCCWLGINVLLVRLSLENGDQLAILDFHNENIPHPPISFSISENDRYLIYVNPFAKRDLIILDLLTWKSQVVNIEFQQYSDANYFVLSPNGTRIVMTIMDNELDHELYSIGMIDLTSGAQIELITGLERGEAFYPIRWTDDDNILLTTDLRHQLSGELLLNINSGSLTEIQIP